jgi:hypothetical protein
MALPGSCRLANMRALVSISGPGEEIGIGESKKSACSKEGSKRGFPKSQAGS